MFIHSIFTCVQNRILLLIIKNCDSLLLTVQMYYSESLCQQCQCVLWFLEIAELKLFILGCEHIIELFEFPIQKLLKKKMV